MLRDPEERKRLRQEKAAQRQKAQAKKLRIQLIAAAVVLFACGALIFFLARRTPVRENPGMESSSSQQTSADTVTEETAPPFTTIHYTAAGDLNINEFTVAAGGASYQYTDTFRDVAHLLSKGDISSLNFEGTLCGDPYGASASAPQSMAEALQKAGVDLIQMANSYSIHRGVSGLATSINGVRAAGMEPLGVYATNQEFKESKGYTIRTVSGIKMAFVAFTKGMDGMALPPGSENCVNVLYSDYDSAYQTIDREKITGILSAVAKEKPDIVIALLHWGSEFNNSISDSQKKIVDLMLSNGVDAIIGTHSHYVQKISFNKETGQFVAYSLGDFFSSAQRAGSEYSVVLDLEITKDNNTGKAKITGFSYTPIFTIHEENQPLRVVRIREAVEAYQNNHLSKVTKETYDKMVYALQRIEARVAGE